MPFEEALPAFDKVDRFWFQPQNTYNVKQNKSTFPTSNIQSENSTQP